MDFNSYRTNREKPLFDNGGDIFTYIYRTPPTTVIHYPMKEGSDIVYYGNRPERVILQRLLNVVEFELIWKIILVSILRLVGRLSLN